MINDRSAGGLRRSPLNALSEADIKFLQSEIAALNADTSVFRFNRGHSWNDEFRASYMAAKNAPNLSVMDRLYLILDAIERAKEAGVSILYNDFIRRCLYGYSNTDGSHIH